MCEMESARRELTFMRLTLYDADSMLIVIDGISNARSNFDICAIFIHVDFPMEITTAMLAALRKLRATEEGLTG